MEKSSIKISLPEKITFAFQKQFGTMIPYIPLVNKNKYILTYIENLFKDENYLDNLLSAELMLRLQLTDELTSVEIGTENGVDLETLIDSGLWNEIEKNFSNYYEFREDIDSSVANILEQKRLEKSLGSVIENLSLKAFAFLDKVSQLDISEANLSKLVGEFKTEATKFAEKYGGPEVAPKKRTKKAE